jgi:hypothetical protein
VKLPAVEKDAAAPAAPRKTLEGTYIPLPEKYYSTDESELTWTVTSGEQTHDVSLR